MIAVGSIFVILLIIIAGFGGYTASKVNALPEVKQWIVKLENKNPAGNELFNDKIGNIIVLPGKTNTHKGIIIYPAAFADEKAYIPVASQFADAGYPVFIAKMPFRLSMMDTENALNFTEKYSDIKKWVMIGHSLGGYAASIFALNHPGKISGLIFWASMPAADMRNSGIKVLHIFASKDGFFSMKSLEDAKKKLPSDTIYFTITGGNHSQFAWYPDMPGDLKADISREAQQRQAISEAVGFMKLIL